MIQEATRRGEEERRGEALYEKKMSEPKLALAQERILKAKADNEEMGSRLKQQKDGCTTKRQLLDTAPMAKAMMQPDNIRDCSCRCSTSLPSFFSRLSWSE
jgi:hypothetical protein